MYQVNIIHFYMIEYIEDDKTMNVEVDLREPIVQIGIICINRWESPYDKEDISVLEKYSIARNIKYYLESVKGMKCEIVDCGLR